MKLCRRPSADTGQWRLLRAVDEDVDAVAQLLGTRLGPESLSITYYPYSIISGLFPRYNTVEIRLYCASISSWFLYLAE